MKLLKFIFLFTGANPPPLLPNAAFHVKSIPSTLTYNIAALQSSKMHLKPFYGHFQGSVLPSTDRCVQYYL